MRIGWIQRAWGAEVLQPAVGWKIWRVDEGRLRSVLYGDLWPIDEPVHAQCNRPSRAPHEAPFRGCECGIHAGRDLTAWDHYLSVDAESRIFGRVLLWGSIIEGTSGWRAACARPVEIFVPTAVKDRGEVADDLLAYGVPVHVLEAVEELVPA